jgi:hypothetical protein
MARSHRPSFVPAFILVALFIAAPLVLSAGAGADDAHLPPPTICAMPSPDAAPVVSFRHQSRRRRRV